LIFIDVSDLIKKYIENKKGSTLLQRSQKFFKRLPSKQIRKY